MDLQTISFSLGIPLWLLAIMLVWTLTWKLIALWISARNNSKMWFILLAVINTMGILEIIYIFAISKCCDKPKKKSYKRKKINF